LLILLLIQLKPKHHRLDILTIFQRGARGAVFRDTHHFGVRGAVFPYTAEGTYCRVQ